MLRRGRLSNMPHDTLPITFCMHLPEQRPLRKRQRKAWSERQNLLPVNLTHPRTPSKLSPRNSKTSLQKVSWTTKPRRRASRQTRSRSSSASSSVRAYRHHGELKRRSCRHTQHAQTPRRGRLVRSGHASAWKGACNSRLSARELSGQHTSPKRIPSAMSQDMGR